MPAIKLLDPEKAHTLAVKLASYGIVPRDSEQDPDVLVSIE